MHFATSSTAPRFVASRQSAAGSLGISHPKLKEVPHKDFADCFALAEALRDQDAAIFCLGTYTGTVSDEELRKTTVDYAIEFARVFRVSSPGASALGKNDPFVLG